MLEDDLNIMNIKDNNKNKSILNEEKVDGLTSEEENLESRRHFLRKYGALAAVTPIAMTLTLHSKKALASSCTECAP